MWKEGTNSFIEKERGLMQINDNIKCELRNRINSTYSPEDNNSNKNLKIIFTHILYSIFLQLFHVSLIPMLWIIRTTF